MILDVEHLWPKWHSGIHIDTRQEQKHLLQQKECTQVNLSTVGRKVMAYTANNVML